MVLFDGPVQRDQGDVRRFAIITIHLGTDMHSIMVLKRFDRVLSRHIALSCTLWNRCATLWNVVQPLCNAMHHSVKHSVPPNFPGFRRFLSLCNQ
jgi:hypothetical protein